MSLYRVELVEIVTDILKRITEREIHDMWSMSIKKWIQTIKYGFVWEAWSYDTQVCYKNLTFV